MATVKPIEIDTYVKFAVKGGFAYAKVISFKDENKTVVLQTPTDCVTEQLAENLIPCTKKEYNKVIKELADNFIAQASEDAGAAENSEAKMSESEAKVKELMAKLAEAEAKIKDMEQSMCAAESKAEAMEKAKCEAEAKLAEAEKNGKDMSAKCEKAESALAAINKKIVSKDRFDKLSAVDATSAIDKDNDKALEVLGEMAESAFNTIYQVAKAQFDKFEAAKASLPKSTDQTQTNLPKGTDQTQTNLPKGTEQTQASAVDEAISTAKKEDEIDLSGVASNASAPDNFNEFISSRLNRKKSEKKVK